MKSISEISELEIAENGTKIVLEDYFIEVDMDAIMKQMIPIVQHYGLDLYSLFDEYVKNCFFEKYPNDIDAINTILK